MRLPDFSSGVRFFLVFVFWGDILKGPCESFAFRQFERNYLVWDDLTVNQDNKGLLDVNSGQNSSRVIVVDKNGCGDSATVQGAVDLVPEGNLMRHKIYIQPGFYREKVHVPKSKPYISFIGIPNRACETVITWHDKAADRTKYGSELGTFESASVTIESDYFCASEVTFENSVVSLPETHNMQAVALRLKGDKAWLHRVRILGTQDSLLDESGLHYFDQCFIQGTVDFIFGNAKSFYQGCTIHSVANVSGAIAANHRDSPDQDTGFSFVGCNISGTGRVLLGRAWGNFSKAMYSYCHFDDIIAPEGWSDWNIPARQRTVAFGEFQCIGKGANRRNRVPWAKTFNFLQAEPFLTTQFIYGRRWLNPFLTALNQPRD